MTFVPYAEAKNIADRFLALLHRLGIDPPQSTSLEDEFLSLTALLEIWSDPAQTENLLNAAPILRAAAGVHDFAAKILCAERSAEFGSFQEHLKLIGSRKLRTFSQNAAADALDDASRKMAELYIASLTIHCGEQIKLDHPEKSKGDNPDIILRYRSRTWALAVKTLVSIRNGQSIFDNIANAAEQINRSAVYAGLIILNVKNVINHDAFWNPPIPFTDVERAIQALMGEVNAIADLADQNRDISDWDRVFTSKVVAPVIFVGQSVIRLPLDRQTIAPTQLKIMVPFARNRAPDNVGLELAHCLNHWMQLLVHGQPGPPPQ